MAGRSNIGKSGENEGGAYKGLDFGLIDRLEREFFFKKSMLTDWFGVSRQRIYKMLDVRDPKWQDCWTGKSLSDSETAILLELAGLRQYDWRQETERCCCLNDRQGSFVCIFVTKYELKAFFLEDLPETVQNELKNARMHILAPAEMKDLTSGAVVSILKQKYFIPANSTQFRANAKNRGLSFEAYAQFLAGCSYARPGSVTDEKIRTFFEANLVDGRVHVSADPDNQWIRSFAARNHYGMEDFIRLYGYQSDTSDKRLTAEAARDRHIEGLRQHLVRDNVVYIPSDSHIYRILNTYACASGRSLNQYVQELGFTRTLDNPVQSSLERKTISQEDVFSGHALIGSKLLETWEMNELDWSARV